MEQYKILKTLGSGSFGIVYQVECKGRQFAAKILHARCFIKQEDIIKFNRECEYLKGLQHPHIVQYHDVVPNPQNSLPTLIMEYMTCSLTHFLEKYNGDIPYHIQVSICCDVASALAYLHSHQLAHRDLSSNNVLLNDKSCAKIGDFGQAKLLQHSGPHSAAPGTEEYLPREALKNPALYNTNLDCYALGVLAIQIATREIPLKGKLDIHVQIENKQEMITIPENYKNAAHDHPLQALAYKCLSGPDTRPTAQQIYYELYELKHMLTNELQIQIQRNQQEYSNGITTMHAKIQELQQVVEHITKTKDEEIAALTTQIHMLQSKHVVPVEQGTLHHQHLASTSQPLQPPIPPVGQFGTSYANVTTSSNNTKAVHSSKFLELKIKSPEISRSCNAVLKDTTVYFRASLERDIHAFETISCKWSQLPCSPTYSCSLAVIQNTLTTIGGYTEDAKATNLLLSLKDTRIWDKLLPPMPTKRARTNSVYNEHALIVAGGETLNGENREPLTVVEVLDINTKQWSTVASLIQPAVSASMVICNDRIFSLGGWSGDHHDDTSKAVLTCSAESLYLSNTTTDPQQVWQTLASLPVSQSTCTTLNGRLLAIGGSDESDNPTSNVFIYNETENKWEQYGTLSTARRLSFAISLPPNKVLVVGGHPTSDRETKTSIMELGQEQVL